MAGQTIYSFLRHGRLLPREEFEAERREFVVNTEVYMFCPVCHQPVFYSSIHYRWDAKRGHSIIGDPVAATFHPCGHTEGDPSLALPAVSTEEPTP
jgi:hypothetical protein